MRRSLACTNAIENMMGTVRSVSRDVKRWRNARWHCAGRAAGMLEATKGFRRLKAHRYLPMLRAALAAHQCKYATQQLNTTSMPHNITHGDVCLAYFNKIWGIPPPRQSR